MDDKFYGIKIPLDKLIAMRLHARSLDLSTQQKVATDHAGGQLSYFRGRGMDFEEVRHYQPGDDIRAMDWRVTARTGKAHTKVYREERERPVYLLVDQSSSMYFGTRVTFKSVIAAQAAALIAWASMANNDRVGGLIFSTTTHQELRPKTGVHGVLPLLKTLAQLQSPEQIQFNITDKSKMFSKALLRLRRVIKPGSAIYLFSDFQSLNEEAEMHLSQLSKHNDIIAGFIYDILEKEPPPPNRYAVSDGVHTLTFDAASEIFRKNYHLRFQQQYEQLTKLLYKHKIPLIELATHTSVTEALRFHLGCFRKY